MKNGIEKNPKCFRSGKRVRAPVNVRRHIEAIILGGRSGTGGEQGEKKKKRRIGVVRPGIPGGEIPAGQTSVDAKADSSSYHGSPEEKGKTTKREGVGEECLKGEKQRREEVGASHLILPGKVRKEIAREKGREGVRRNQSQGSPHQLLLRIREKQGEDPRPTLKISFAN